MHAAEVAEETIRPAVGARDRAIGPYAWTIPGLVVVALMLVWAIHDGGYDADTWYWGALVVLGLLAAVVVVRGWQAIQLSRAAKVALGAFALYVAWSYLSIAWATSPGDALTGSNRALLYFLVFATMLVLPWTVPGALVALLTFVLGIGVVAIVLLVRLASTDHVAALLISGRLAAPTGYFNSTAALFTIEALMAIALAARRELPGLLRGLLIGFACAGLQLGVIVQSRGWLFTLPLVLIAAIVLLPDRLRVAGAAILPAAAALAVVHQLLHVYEASSAVALNRASSQAGHSALRMTLIVFVVGTLIAWIESLLPTPRPSAVRRRVLGILAVLLAAGAALTGALALSHGHPFSYISRQWHGFSHQGGVHTGSHFTDLGSGRYDFWRVALDGFVAHPVGGLGQDNFYNYYVPRRRTGEEPSWTHSIELRLLTHTGLAGTVLFVVFLVAGIAASLRGRRRGQPEAAVADPAADQRPRGPTPPEAAVADPAAATALHRRGPTPPAAAVAATALLPFIVWLIYGSVDWFWEMPALSGPALGFLGMAAALGARNAPGETTPGPATGAITPRPTRSARLAGALGVLALLAAVVVLGFPYLSVREASIGSDLGQNDPAKALHALSVAADLDPLSASPSRLAGYIALTSRSYGDARARFEQAISRDPGGWYAWLGAGLAASALGDRAQARQDFKVAASIDPRNALIAGALADVGARHPLTPAAALQLLSRPL
ncbi:MAG TPA: O-antigen ligase family protein [Solirubrobacteraceae bacterium]|nr:O-antigen ligase family protein [Solirubrobacteraceae bacterium]